MKKLEKFNLTKLIWTCVTLIITGGFVVPTTSHAMEDSEVLREEGSSWSSTSTAFNPSGLEINFGHQSPELGDLNWHNLSFSTEQEKIKFNQLVLESLCLFLRISPLTPANYETEEWKNLVGSSDLIVQQAQRAQLAYKNQNPQGWLATNMGINIFEERDKQPLIPLFQWLSEYAKGNVTVKHGYRKHAKTTVELFPIISYTNQYDYTDLKNYASVIEELLSRSDQIYSAEYGLHMFIFGSWYVVSKYGPPQGPYKINYLNPHGMGIFWPYSLEIPNITEPACVQYAHPIFSQLFNAKKNTKES